MVSERNSCPRGRRRQAQPPGSRLPQHRAFIVRRAGEHEIADERCDEQAIQTRSPSRHAGRRSPPTDLGAITERHAEASSLTARAPALDQIAQGELDAHLTAIADAINARINHPPQYLRGVEGVVIEADRLNR